MKQLLMLFALGRSAQKWHAKRVVPHWVQYEWLWVSMVLAVAVFVVTNVYAGGFPYTHDGENHLARFMNTAAAVREGQFPPRFASYVLSGYGFPVLQYNYPLANLLAVPFIWFGFHPAVVFVGLVRVFWWLSGLAWYALLRSHRRGVALLASVSWLASAYFVVAVAYRGNIGEVLALAGVPIVLWLWNRWLQPVESRVGYWRVLIPVVGAAWLLSHNVLILLLSPWIGFWTLGVAHHRRRLLDWFVGWSLSAGLVLWFWLPALLELPLIVLQYDSLAQQAADHAVSWAQLWWMPWQFGFSRPGLLDSIGMSFGLPARLLVLLSVVVSVGWLAQPRWAWQRLNATWQKTPFAVWSGGFVVAALLVSIGLTGIWSVGIWESIGALSIIQFPWRWMAVTTAVFPILLWWLWPRVIWPVRVLIVLGVFLQLSWAWKVKPADRLTYAPEYYRQFAGSTTTRNENRPTTLVFEPYNWGDWSPAPRIVEGQAMVSVQHWDGTHRRYSIDAQTDVLIQEPTVYFPGWRVLADGQPQEMVFEDNTYGLTAYRLPARPGQPYQITTRFGEFTLWRQVADALTLFSAVLMFVWWWQRRTPGILMARTSKLAERLSWKRFS